MVAGTPNSRAASFRIRSTTHFPATYLGSHLIHQLEAVVEHCIAGRRLVEEVEVVCIDAGGAGYPAKAVLSCHSVSDSESGSWVLSSPDMED